MTLFDARRTRCGLLALAATLLALTAPAQTRTLRVVTYNIEADINGTTTPRPGLIAPPGSPNNVQAGGVLEGIGEETVGADGAQPADLLALQETTGNAVTVAPIVNALNAFYGVAGMYANSSYQATQAGGSTNNAFGNGPNALVFNTRTVRLLASVPVDPPGGPDALGAGSGEWREVMRYQFAPAGVAATTSNVFYLYVSHYKSGTTSSDLTQRLGEAQIIRASETLDLPVDARVLYVGDYNVTSSGEASYQAILSNIAPNGAPQGGGVDPLNPAGIPKLNWGAFTADTNILALETESATSLRYRDDLQLMTTNVFYGVPGGLKYVSGTYHVFGNNGSVGYYGRVNAGTNTALNDRLAATGPVFLSAAQLYLDLTNASDHLPVVADYTIPVPAPRITGASLAGADLTLAVADGITNAVYTVLTSTNLAAAPAKWTAVASHTASGGNFTFTVTNAAGATAPERFFMLRGK